MRAMFRFDLVRERRQQDLRNDNFTKAYKQVWDKLRSVLCSSFQSTALRVWNYLRRKSLLYVNIALTVPSLIFLSSSCVCNRRSLELKSCSSPLGTRPKSHYQVRSASRDAVRACCPNAESGAKIMWFVDICIGREGREAVQ